MHCQLGLSDTALSCHSTNPGPAGALHGEGRWAIYNFVIWVKDTAHQQIDELICSTANLQDAAADMVVIEKDNLCAGNKQLSASVCISIVTHPPFGSHMSLLLWHTDLTDFRC
jgi:hypothetical protein